jgi:hypothetical protein
MWVIKSIGGLGVKKCELIFVETGEINNGKKSNRKWRESEVLARDNKQKVKMSDRDDKLRITRMEKRYLSNVNSILLFFRFRNWIGWHGFCVKSFVKFRPSVFTI